MYSEKYNTIFVHIPKAGGQSVENAFLAEHGLSWAKRRPLLLYHNDDPTIGPRQMAHMFAREYVGFGHVTQDIWDRAFKFTVVRNPYDRAISQYRYSRPQQIQSMDHFVRFLERKDQWRHGVAQWQFVLDNGGQMMVDHIVRLENLSAEFPDLSQKIFGKPVELPHVNKSKSERPADADDPEIRRRLYKLYEKDFDLFKYPSGL